MPREALPSEFPTRVDTWLLAVVGGGLLVSLGAVALAAREDPRAGLFGSIILAASTALVVALSVPTRYSIGEKELVIRSGVLRYRIPLGAIRRVYPTHNPLSAPAWSLRRLGIEYDRGRGRALALISPARDEEFLALLAVRADLVAVGRELRRRT